MGFTIKCDQCGAEIELHQSGQNTEKIYSHSNGIACDCGNKIYNNLTKEYRLLISQCHPGTQEHFIRLENFRYHLIGDEAFWVRGCLSRALGIVDSAVTILELLPIATYPIEEGYAPIAAMSKATYSYENMMSLFHDLLDNIGYMYMEKVLKNKKVKTPSFLKLFESEKLSEPSNDAELNDTMQSLYKKTNIYANKDNKYKHSFSAGLVDLNQQGEFIRKNGKESGNIGYFLYNGAVSMDKALSDAKKIKDEILYLALTCAVQLIYYEREGLL